MRKDKEKAIALRRDGASYSAIVTKLKISRGTLSSWFAGADWSDKVRARAAAHTSKASAARMLSLNQVRGANLQRAYVLAREEARSEFQTMKYHPLFIAGVMLYWGEGDLASKQQVRLSNADPRLLRLYVEFLRRICLIPIEKVRGAITAYAGTDAAICEQFWAGRTSIPRSNFTKTMHITGRSKNKRLAFGTCAVIVSSAYFKAKMQEWVRLVSGELMNKEYYESI